MVEMEEDDLGFENIKNEDLEDVDEHTNYKNIKTVLESKNKTALQIKNDVNLKNKHQEECAKSDDESELNKNEI